MKRKKMMMKKKNIYIQMYIKKYLPKGLKLKLLQKVIVIINILKMLKDHQNMLKNNQILLMI